MRALVTGGAGFIGSNLVDRLLSEGYEVTIIDNLSSGSQEKIRSYLDNPLFNFIQESVLNEEVIKTQIKNCDVIFHLAAMVGVENYISSPYDVLNVNINGTQLILKFAYEYGKKVIFSSTSEIYGKNPLIPFSEVDDRVLGSTKIHRWCYSSSKAVGEHLCFAYAEMGLQVVILRFFNLYGPRADSLNEGRVITVFLGRMFMNEPVPIIGDGKQTRSFCYIEDAINGIIRAQKTEEACGEVINIGSNEEVTILELARMMKKISKSKSKIIFVKKESVYGNSYEDIPRRVPDISLARKILHFSPTTKLNEGLERTIHWFKESNLKK